MSIRKHSLNLVMAVLILSVSAVQALIVVEDFENYEQSPLIYASGGSGFLDHWSSGNMNVATGQNLSCSTTGYAVSSLGTGMCIGTNENAAKISFRKIAEPISGTTAGREVWLSVLLAHKYNERIGLHLNPTAYDRSSADAGFLAVGTDLRKLDDGVLISTGLTISYNTTHLILGRIMLKDTGESTVEYWLDPTDVTSTNTLGAADITFAANFGSSIMSVGMEGYYGSPAMDAMRLSDGSGDGAQAFIDVTRATSSILFGPVEFASLHELTNNFALLDATTNDWTADDDGNHGQGGYLKTLSFVTTHHIFVIDSDGVSGGGNDIFGECTIDFDCRGNSHYGVCFFGQIDPTKRDQKQWILVSASSQVRSFYNKTLSGSHTLEETDSSYSLDGSEWRHVRVDVRRTNNFSQVEARVRVWDNSVDFRETPAYDHNFIYAADHSHPYAGEIAFTSYYDGTRSGELDNIAVYRYGSAPDWFEPKGTLIMLQ
ncbi:MAG: hypothetical protein PF904_11790 [Kiritimatiellae bacterium]|nr:hypothetical protein [Kiritimatiellia bacterium]